MDRVNELREIIYNKYRRILFRLTESSESHPLSSSPASAASFSRLKPGVNVVRLGSYSAPYVTSLQGVALPGRNLASTFFFKVGRTCKLIQGQTARTTREGQRTDGTSGWSLQDTHRLFWLPTRTFFAFAIPLPTHFPS